MRFGLRPSIANGIFAIAAILLVLMTAVTAVGAFMSMRIGEAIGTVGERYVPAYGMLARAHVRSLEQSLALRRAAIRLLEDPPDPKSVSDLIAVADGFGAQAVEELASAQKALGERVRNGLDFGDELALGRLDAQYGEIFLQRQVYDERLDELEAALRSGNRAAVAEALGPLDEIRDEIGERLEQARRGTLELAGNAVEYTRKSQRQVIVLSFIALGAAILAGLLLAWRYANRLVRSVAALLSATEAVEQGRYDTELPVTSGDEVGRLSRAFNHMVAELRLKEKIRETFGRYVDPRVATGLIERPELVAGAGDRRMMTVLFCDMKGFTGLSEEVTPTSLVTLLNRYFTLMSQAIRDHGGVVDKYMGDSVMAFFGPPFVGADQQARLACTSAIAQLESFSSFQAEIPDLLGYRRFVPEIGLRIGIATGDVIVGNVGSDVAMSYTVMGDTVNMASRIEGANRIYGTRILMADATARLVEAEFLLREIDLVVLKGRAGAVALHEPLCLRKDAGAAETALAGRYGEALAAYRKREFERADGLFSECLEIRPGDSPSGIMAERSRRLATEMPGPDWDGAWRLSEK
jgi:class 3 adenylate cyclase